MLYSTLTPLDKTSAYGYVDINGPVERETQRIGHNFLTAGSVYTLTEKNKRHFAVQLEMGPSHKFIHE